MYLSYTMAVVPSGIPIDPGLRIHFNFGGITKKKQGFRRGLKIMVSTLIKSTRLRNTYCLIFLRLSNRQLARRLS